MKIAIGTKSPPKVSAIEEAATNCKYFKKEKIEVTGKKVDSGISDMPLSLDETIHGAHTRAKNIKEKIKNADLYIGMEWWVTIIRGIAYLFWVVYIIDKTGKEHFGISPMMQVPEEFRRRIYENKEELGPVLTEITWEKWASKKGGAFAHRSDDMVTRKDQFILAFTTAICPFYNEYY